MISSSDLEKTERFARAATPGPWTLDHDDTYVAAEKSPPEPADWYWITGSLEKKPNGYDYAFSDEDLRGPKETVQANCRFIAHMNPARTLEMVAETKRLREELKNLREWNSDLEEQNGRVAIKNQLLEGKIATLEFDLPLARGFLEEAIRALEFSEAAQKSLHAEILYHREEARMLGHYSDAFRLVDEEASNKALRLLRDNLQRLRASRGEK